MKSPLPKLARREIESALRDAKRAQAYLLRPDVSLCCRSRERPVPPALSFSREPLHPSLVIQGTEPLGNYSLSESNKEIGSDIAGLSQAIYRLERLLEIDDANRAAKRAAKE